MHGPKKLIILSIMERREGGGTQLSVGFVRGRRTPTSAPDLWAVQAESKPTNNWLIGTGPGSQVARTSSPVVLGLTIESIG